MLTNCLAACAHLTITVSEIERYIGQKSPFIHTPLHSTPPLGGFPSEYRHPVWYGKTRMVCLPDGEKFSKISLFVLAQLTNVTDRRTKKGWRHIPRLCIASRGKSYDNMLSRFHLILERHGQTDRFAISISRVSVLTRDKNWLPTVNLWASRCCRCLQHQVDCTNEAVRQIFSDL